MKSCSATLLPLWTVSVTLGLVDTGSGDTLIKLHSAFHFLEVVSLLDESFGNKNIVNLNKALALADLLR